MFLFKKDEGWLRSEWARTVIEWSVTMFALDRYLIIESTWWFVLMRLCECNFLVYFLRWIGQSTLADQPRNDMYNEPQHDDYSIFGVSRLALLLCSCFLQILFYLEGEGEGVRVHSEGRTWDRNGSVFFDLWLMLANFLDLGFVIKSILVSFSSSRFTRKIDVTEERFANYHRFSK